MLESKTTAARPLVGSGSLFNSSEGLLSAALTTLVSGVVTGDYPDTLKMVAIGGLSFSVAAYTIARALVKRHA
jgi:hypothetical protein